MNRLLRTTLWLLALLVFAVGTATADDTEIYYAQAQADNDQNKSVANVLFFIDTSGSMEWSIHSTSKYPPAGQSRMYQLKEAFRQVVEGLDDDVHIGLGKFNGGYDSSGYGGYVFQRVQERTASDRNALIDIVDDLKGTSNTPTMEAYSEMARYMLGLSPTGYAEKGEAKQNKPAPAINMTREWDECASRNWRGCQGGYVWQSRARYLSPMDSNNQCESNHIIVMTDGEPTQDYDYSSVKNLTGKYCNSSYSCQKQLAAWLLDESANGRKSVKTWQIGFGPEIKDGSATFKNMNKVAKAGGTDHARKADNAEQLANEFNDILNLIAKHSQSIVSPGVTINQNNRLEHLDQLYYAIFKPEKVSVWDGNLKRYRLGDGQIVDRSGNAAVDSDTGFFKQDAKSWWSTEPDGADVTKGGARGVLAGRTLYVGRDNGASSYKMTPTLAHDADPDLFGIPANDPLFSYNTTDKVYDALQTLWADPLHSVPLLVTYNDSSSYVFVSTNGGMLHAIDTDDGKEVFSFMPYMELSKAYDFVRSPSLLDGNTRSLYGLDGSWVAWRKADADGNADQVYIYGGMRRGGHAYFALNVSDINQPSLMWRVRGPGDGYSEDSGFKHLGQTWSTPTLTHVRIGGDVKTVLVFGGGYNPDSHDTAGTRDTDNVAGGGNAIYMVDATNGKLLWSAGKAGNGVGEHTRVDAMKWSVPGGIAVVDLNFDGLADYFYFADMGGQVFRVNLDNNQSAASDLVSGVVRIADLASSSTANQRRFYEAPAVGYQRNGRNDALYVAVGSGYRAHPLDEQTKEEFFVIADRNFRSANQPTSAVTPSDLTTVDGDQTTADATGKGWRYKLTRDGEKVLAAPTIFQNSIFFTTYVPPDDQSNTEQPCTVNYGTGYAYRMTLFSGKAQSFTNDGTVSSNGTELGTSAIPASVMPVVIDGDGGRTVYFDVGAELVGQDQLEYQNMRKYRWYQLPRDDANQYFPMPDDD